MSPQHPLPVVFIGPMASGKSRIGRRVAKALDVPFIDTDSRVVAEHGPISEIFTRDGEPAFRALERQAVVGALNERAVVSLGGGAVLDARTQADLAAATVVLLTVSPDVVSARIGGDKRPLLADGGIDAWQRILDERLPIYTSLADVIFDTSVGPITDVADRIVEWVRGTA